MSADKPRPARARRSAQPIEQERDPGLRRFVGEGRRQTDLRDLDEVGLRPAVVLRQLLELVGGGRSAHQPVVTADRDPQPEVAQPGDWMLVDGRDARLQDFDVGHTSSVTPRSRTAVAMCPSRPSGQSSIR